jgi:hypothetical protein
MCLGLMKMFFLPFPIHGYKFTIPVDSKPFQNTIINTAKKGITIIKTVGSSTTPKQCHLFQFT